MPVKKAKYKVGDQVSTLDGEGEVISRTYISKANSAKYGGEDEGYWSYEIEIAEPTYHTYTEEYMKRL